jgi:hypothetical protein
MRSRPGWGLGFPSIPALFFAFVALSVPVVFGHRLLDADGDLARHLVLGAHILENGVVFPDVFSHTRAGQPFLAYEWLSEVLLHLVEQAGGLAGVAVFAGALIAASLALVMAYLRRSLDPIGLVVVGGLLVVVFTGPHWIARPHLFTFLGLSCLLHVATRSPSWKRDVALGGLFAIWANLHPGFFYGLAILGAFLLGDALDNGKLSRLRRNGTSMLSAGIGTLLHPLGWGLHQEIFRHLADRRAFVTINEFIPPDLSSAFGFLFFVCVSLLIVAVSVQRRRPSFSALLPFLAALFAALLARRNIPLFALFALPLIVESLSDVFRRMRLGPLATSGLSLRVADSDARTAPWMVLAVTLLLGLGLAEGRVGSAQVVPNAFSPKVFPVEAVSRARAAGLEQTRMFNEYVWGGYILYAWSEQRVYIDSMANFYGGELMDEYRSVMWVQEGWRNVLRERGIDLLLIGRQSRLAREAAESDEWNVWYEDETAVVLVRA